MTIRLGVAGLGKMGLSHLAMINTHPEVTVAAVCDPAGYVLDVLNKYTGVRTHADFGALLAEPALDAVIVATPSALHASMVQAALGRGLHVFCEKPFCLDGAEGERAARSAEAQGLVNQVGYHCRFVGAFQEVGRLLDAGAIGEVSHALAEAYGPVVLKSRGATWRSRRAEGGGCLYDYAAHPLNLLTWYFGAPRGVGGTVLNKIFSSDTDDEVFTTLYFDGGKSAQLSVNWSDESHRKMSTRVSVWGSKGRIVADRQEVQAYLRDGASAPPGYRAGWNVRYTTALSAPVDFYLRGEEYSAQLDYFVRCIQRCTQQRRAIDNVNSFASALETDRVIAMMLADAARGPAVAAPAAGAVGAAAPGAAAPARKKGLFSGARAGARHAD